MSSIYGLVGPDFTVYEGTGMTMPAAYSAIKGGINNLTRYLASYFGSSQIRVNTVSPGGVFDSQNELFVKNYVNKVPMKRMGMPMDVVAAVFFLLTDESSYITGHNLVVDGGWSAI
jgi:NAD(P)-dependent dehydrogenase (short-subunit alcohol dehydrogenase family)